MTDGERRLWWVLRRKQLSGFRFRRQATIGPYIADFFCPLAKLVIEVDGVPHVDEERMYRDQARTRWLEAHGYRVIRFWNIDVFKRPVEVTEAIYHALTHPPSAPSGHLPPQGGKAKVDCCASVSGFRFSARTTI
jgi:very-short-patch-repair endonuclease